MKKQQAGFTLIELIAVIVILGILAATAVPRFVDMSQAASQAAVDGIAGNLASGSALNYAAYVATNAGVNGAPAPVAGVIDCVTQNLTLDGGLPPGGEYTIGGADPGAAGASGTCTVTFDPGADGNPPTYTANFTGYVTQ